MFKFNFDIEEDGDLDPSNSELFQLEGTAASTSSTQETTSVEDSSKEISVVELVRMSDLLSYHVLMSFLCPGVVASKCDFVFSALHSHYFKPNRCLVAQGSIRCPIPVDFVGRRSGRREPRKWSL